MSGPETSRSREDVEEQVQTTVDKLDLAARSHAGGLRLVDVQHTEDGADVTVAFTGMCTGCGTRPLCGTATMEPVLLAVPGVREVTISGVRLSAAARARLLAAVR